MISLEATGEGFAVSVDGRRVISHSRRSPCLELGRAEGAARSTGSSGIPRRGKVRAAPLRGYKVAESAPDYLALDFDGRIRMALRLKEERLRISFSRYDAGSNHFRLRLAASPEERIYGGGDRGSGGGLRLDLKGSRVPLWVRDAGSPGEARRSAAFVRGVAAHYPVPAFLSTGGYWCAVDTSAYALLDFRRRASTLIEAWAVPRELVLGFAPDASSILADMTAVLGRQAEPPSWCFDGVCLGLSGGEADVEARLAEALDAGVKIGAVWLRDWCGPRSASTGLPSDWSRDAGLYPDLPGLSARLRSRGIRCLGSVGPVLPAGGALRAEAAALGILVKDPFGKDYLLPQGESGFAMVDLSSPAGMEWMKELIARELVGAGMSGWSADYGEQLPPDAVLSSGEEAVRAHNRWPVLWARVNREAAEASGNPEGAFFFLRSGWLGVARQSRAAFAGERAASFSRREGLPSVVPSALSLGLSGVGFWHSETGGCLPPRLLERLRPGARARRAECLGRWMELSTFTPFFRVAYSRDRAGLDASSVALLARMSEAYAALKPYHVAVAAEYGATGLPPIRHPWIHYGSDPHAHRLEYQYLYGRDLMVAPALEPSLALTDLYLPEDEWVHLWSSRVFRGGRVTVESPLGCPAVFYRAGSEFSPLFDALRRTVRKA